MKCKNFLCISNGGDRECYHHPTFNAVLDCEERKSFMRIERICRDYAIWKDEKKRLDRDTI